MLRILSYVQLLFLISQFIIYINKGIVNEFVIISFVLLLIVLLFQIKIFRSELKEFSKRSRKEKYLNSFLLLFLLLIGFQLNSLGNIEKAGTLASLQEVPNIGLIFKVGGTIIPVMAFSFFFSRISMKKKIGIFLLSFLISAYTSITILSKQPLIPYFIFLLFMVQQKLISRKYFILLFFLFIPPVIFVYFLRGSADNIQDVIVLMIFRITMLAETSHIMLWIQEHNALGYIPLSEYPAVITRDVFDYDPRYIGIAPSFLGFFIVIFGQFGIIIPFIFIKGTSVLIKLINTSTLEGRLIYFFWVVELLSFFTDGIPHFYLSTSNGKLFWILVILTIIKIASTQRMIKQKAH